MSFKDSEKNTLTHLDQFSRNDTAANGMEVGACLMIESANSGLHGRQQCPDSKVLREALDVIQVGLGQALPIALIQGISIKLAQGPIFLPIKAFIDDQQGAWVRHKENRKGDKRNITVLS